MRTFSRTVYFIRKKLIIINMLSTLLSLKRVVHILETVASSRAKFMIIDSLYFAHQVYEFPEMLSVLWFIRLVELGVYFQIINWCDVNCTEILWESQNLNILYQWLLKSVSLCIGYLMLFLFLVGSMVYILWKRQVVC